nr:MAG TPA: hypothetical protein [Caudoviricetes sp.]
MIISKIFGIILKRSYLKYLILKTLANNSVIRYLKLSKLLNYTIKN